MLGEGLGLEVNKVDAVLRPDPLEAEGGRTCRGDRGGWEGVMNAG